MRYKKLALVGGRAGLFRTGAVGHAMPFDERLGFGCVEAIDGRATYRATADASWHNPTGRLHGGFLAALADAAMGAAYSASLGAGAAGTNMDLDLRFLRPVHAGALLATARTVKRGATVSLMACDIVDEEGRLVAVARSQFLRLPPPDDGTPLPSGR